MKTPVTVLVLGLLALGVAALLAACEQPTEPVEPPSPAFHHSPDHPNADHERLWGENIQWVFLRPRPPGIGSNAERVPVYMIAPVDENDPLSRAIELFPGATRGEVDQVTGVPRGSRGEFNATALTVPVHHPTWNAETCVVDAFADEDRILWRIVDVPPPPCFAAAMVYAVDFEGDGECFEPLTSAERVEEADAMGLVDLQDDLPEPPWPFSARQLTEPGQGAVTVASPACVNGG